MLQQRPTTLTRILFDRLRTLTAAPQRSRRDVDRLQVDALEARLLLTNVIDVTTFDDVVDENDGVTSLREAVIEANATTDEETEIRLGDGTYTLSITGAGGAEEGDLDLTTSQRVTIAGAGEGETTIDATGLTEAVFDLNRRLHNRLVVRSLTVANVGTAIHSDRATLQLEDVTFENAGGASLTDTRATIIRCVFKGASGRAIGANGGRLTIVDSLIRDNQSGGISNHRGTVVIFRTNILENRATRGGGIFNSYGTVTLHESTIAHNHASLFGGGIYTTGTRHDRAVVNLVNSTLAHNRASGDIFYNGGNGGGIYMQEAAETNIRHSTIAYNSGDRDGYGGVPEGVGLMIAHGEGVVNLDHALIAGNRITGEDTTRDIFGNVSSSRFSLVADSNHDGGVDHGVQGNIVGRNGGGAVAPRDILSEQIGENGGPTLTHVLATGSPALDAGDPEFIAPPRIDQRGLSRTFGRIDIGAVETGADDLPVLVDTWLNIPGEVADGTTVGTIAYEGFGADGEPVYFIVGDASSPFTIDPQSGEMTVSDADAVTEPAYTILVRAYDSQSTQSTHLMAVRVTRHPGRPDGLLGYSDGTWSGSASTDAGFETQALGEWDVSGLTDVLHGDFNGDGAADVAARNPIDGTWTVFASGDAGHSHTTWARWSTSVAWQDVVTGDFDGDGDDDIAGRTDNNASWWVALAEGGRFANRHWGVWPQVGPWADVLVDDFDGDGRDDIVGRINGEWWAALSAGSTFNTRRFGLWSGAQTWVDVSSGDFNGDGQADVVGRRDGVWTVGLSNGTTFDTRTFGRWSDDVTWNDVLFGDFNGDGRTDVAGRANGNWWVATSTGTKFLTRHTIRWSTAIDWRHVTVGDFDGDGRADIAGRTDNNGSWWVAFSEGVTFTNRYWGRWPHAAGWDHVSAGNASA